MFLQQIANGVALGCVYSLIAVGFTMVFSVIEIINFSHGAVFMLGAYLGLTFLDLGLIPALVLSVVSMTVIGVLVEKLTIYPLRRAGASRVIFLVSTLGVLTCLTGAAELIWGTDARAFRLPFEIRIFEFWNVTVSVLEIVILAVTVASMLSLHIFLRRFKTGRAIRAVNENPKAASAVGVNIDKIISLNFAIGSALGALGGLLVGVYYGSIHPSISFGAGIKGFIAAVLGGMGSVPGAALGGLALGLAETFGGSYVSFQYRDAIAFVLLISILIVRPSGLLGLRSVQKV